jgi:hypothetical protein
VASPTLQPVRRPKTLRAHLLKFGDVILSSGYELKDLAVVLGTRRGIPERRYSHAAFVFTQSMWLESTGEGTGLTHFPVTQSFHGNAVQTLIDVSHNREIDVFRLPDPDILLIDPHSTEFQKILGQFIGFQYPRLEDLANTTNWLKRFPKLKRRIMATFNSETVTNPGAFCSQLIIELLDTCKGAGLIKASVLKADLPSGNISPNDLADPRLSRLVRMEGFVEREAISVLMPDRSSAGKMIAFDFDPNVMVKASNKLRADIVASKTNAKLVKDLSIVLQTQAAEFAKLNASMLKQSASHLLFSEDDPNIEDVKDRPELRLIQEQALESGLNPGWIRLEGLATHFVNTTEKCNDVVRSCASGLESLFSAMNRVPKSKLYLLVRNNARWLARTPEVLALYRLSIKNMCTSQEFYLRGFPSDHVWIDFIRGTAEAFVKSLSAFSEFLFHIEEVWRTADHLPLLARHTAKMHLKHVRRLKKVANETVENVRLFADSVAGITAKP